MSELKLYEIAAEIEAALMADELDEDRLNELVASMEDKAAATLCVIDRMQTFVNVCKTEEKRIKSRREASENSIKRVESYIQNCMEAANFAKIDIGTKTISIKKNPPALVVDNEEIIPARFFTIIPESTQLDKASVKRALKAGEIVPGVHTEQGLSLAIK